jgi:hypothetical protein
MVGGRWIAGVVCVSAFVLLASAETHASGRDRTPPVFAGLTSATTCIPGPVGGKRTGSFRLVWTAAHDKITRASLMVYDVYEARSPGTENFSRATYTTRRGATSFATPPLPSTETYYFVVRARDAAGNRDRNRRERPGRNLCL